jgi:hypothetical protein
MKRAEESREGSGEESREERRGEIGGHFFRSVYLSFGAPDIALPASIGPAAQSCSTALLNINSLANTSLRLRGLHTHEIMGSSGLQFCTHQAMLCCLIWYVSVVHR